MTVFIAVIRVKKDGKRSVMSMEKYLLW